MSTKPTTEQLRKTNILNNLSEIITNAINWAKVKGVSDGEICSLIFELYNPAEWEYIPTDQAAEYVQENYEPMRNEGYD